MARLTGWKVFVDGCPGVGLGISPYFFNTEDEVSDAMEIIAITM
ncbi:MAG: hypothetical protein ABIP14_08295 [Blastocatellia bacterium]